VFEPRCSRLGPFILIDMKLMRDDLIWRVFNFRSVRSLDLSLMLREGGE
jgi:hypothetical protein